MELQREIERLTGERNEWFSLFQEVQAGRDQWKKTALAFRKQRIAYMDERDRLRKKSMTAEQRIKDLEAAVELLNRTLSERTNERDQLESLLVACQKAIKDLQAQRDRAREGKR